MKIISLSKYSYIEKELLEITDHPFIIKLHHAFQTKTRLYLILDYMS